MVYVGMARDTAFGGSLGQAIARYHAQCLEPCLFIDYRIPQIGKGCWTLSLRFPYAFRTLSGAGAPGLWSRLGFILCW